MKSTYLIRLPVLTCRRCVLAHLREVRLAGLGKGARLRRVVVRKAAARRGVRKTVGRARVRRTVKKAAVRRRVRKTVGRARVRRAVKKTGARRVVRTAKRRLAAAEVGLTSPMFSSS